ncbi:MAG: ABC transporter substrate-binding protein, partial [Arcobacteraceae bacterium]
MLRILLVVILFLTLLNGNDKITLQLNWKYQYEFAGYIAAIEKGFYKEAGIDVILKEYDNNVDVIGNVLSGESDLGIYGSSLVEIGSKNDNLILISNYFKRSALVIVGNQNILTPNDLIGKKVMAGGYELDNTSLATLLKKFGISKSDFSIVPHSFRIDEFINGEVDA